MFLSVRLTRFLSVSLSLSLYLFFLSIAAGRRIGQWLSVGGSSARSKGERKGGCALARVLE